MAKLDQKYASCFSKWRPPVKKFRLLCSEQELAKRIIERIRVEWQKQQKLTNMRAAQESFDALFPNNELFHLIETTTLTKVEVAEQILLLAYS